MSLKTHYSASQIATFQLKSVPHTKANVIAKAKREGWVFRPRSGKGGGYEYAFDSLPAEVQAEIRQKITEQALKAPVPELIADYEANAPKKAQRKKVKTSLQTPPKKHLSAGNFDFVMATRNTVELNQKQRDVADSRLAVVAYVNKLSETSSRKKATEVFVAQANAYELPDYIQSHVQRAVTRKSKKVISHRTVTDWLLLADKANTTAERLNALAPFKQGRKQKKPVDVSWFPDFMAIYRNKNGICVAQAYETFQQYWAETHTTLPCPSLTTVRRMVNQLPPHVREIGRKTGASMRALKTYVKRDWSDMRANDVWCGDGHSMKLKVAHPIHGRPFTPELTLVMDCASRYIVGYSLALSENTLAVADAIRHAVSRHGIPAIYYSDGGSGQANAILDADITGILPRMGVEHPTGIPNNPQARGIIERVNKTLAIRIAREFATFYGEGADSDTVRKTLYAVESLDKARREGKELTPLQKKAIGKLPSWQQLIDEIERQIKWYNETHIHSELGTTPHVMRKKQLDQLSPDEFFRLSEAELRDLFRPQIERKAQRGWIKLFKKDYWHEELINHKNVIVAYDIHDPSFVIVRDLNGDFICDAKLNGNTRAGFAKSYVDEQREKRADQAIKRKQQQIDAYMAEKNDVLEGEFSEIPFIDAEELTQVSLEDEKPIFHTNADREAWEEEQLMKKANGE